MFKKQNKQREKMRDIEREIEKQIPNYGEKFDSYQRGGGWGVRLIDDGD